MPLKWL